MGTKLFKKQPIRYMIELPQALQLAANNEHKMNKKI